MIGSKLKIYGSAGYIGAANWILGMGHEATSDIREADVIVFGGGQDIDSGFYKEKKGMHTGRPGERDKREQTDFLIGKESGKKMVGICRGSQLVCALSGGKLIQHVEGHGGRDHAMSTYDRQPVMRVNSLHHQMMFPYTMPRKDYKILGWTTKPLSDVYLNGNNRDHWLPQSFKEPEIIKFNNSQSLGIQFHPEMMYHSYHSRDSGYDITNAWLVDLFNKFIHDEI